MKPLTALDGIRVLDLSRILAGPGASQILGDLGAEVIKIEQPEVGDDTRQWGPPFIQGAANQSNTTTRPDSDELLMSAYFSSVNRNKKSVTLDFTQKTGQEMIHQLLQQSDVLIENFKVGKLAEYGLGYEQVRHLNPKLIYCSITGFGQTGPRANQAGYDFMIQGLGGLMSVTGNPDETVGGEPLKVGVAVVDVMTGLYASNAILAALFARAQTGQGQYIDMALFDVQVATLANQASNFLITGVAPKRLGNAHPNIVPYQAFPSQDGNIILAVGNDGQFQKFCKVADAPEIANDVLYAKNQDRVKNRKILIPILAALIKERTTKWWINSLEKEGVPCGPINTIAQVFADPQTHSRELRHDMSHPQLGTIPVVKNPMNLSETPPHYQLPPPLLGEHTDTVLQSLLGFDENKCQELRLAKII